MAYSNVLYEKKGHIVYITLNRPEKLNAIDGPMGQSICQAIRDYNADDEAWVAIVTGTGERAFSAGSDIKYLAEHPEIRQGRLAKRDLFDYQNPSGFATYPLQVWKPLIAAVNGYCVGGGFELALYCDVIIASTNASFGLMEVTHGWPAGNGTFELSRQAPLKLAMEMLLTGDRFSADDAFRRGLVNKVVPPSELLAEATKLAERICENPPLAVRAAKELVMRGRDLPKDYPPTVWNLQIDSYSRVIWNSEDAKEGAQAFVEKRKPVFKGR